MKGKNGIVVIAVFFLFCAASGFAAPHVAVLNAILTPGMDPTVSVPVTDKIIEELVKSGRYTVIDRANVEQVLQEKEFQLSSGIVHTEEVRQAGEYLGADFVIVVNASRVGSTYVISAKMVDVVTGEIATQASAEKQGKIDVLLQIARTVGRQISGQEVAIAEPPVEEPVVAEVSKKVEKETKPEPAGTDNAMAVAQLQELIRRRIHMRKGGAAQMMPLVASLSEQQKMLLYTSNRKNNAALSLLLNWLVPSLGSFIQGDVTGGIVELSLIVTGIVLMVNGIEESYEEDFWGYEETTYEYTTGFYIGVVALGVYVVFYIVRPFTFQSKWNRNLAAILQVPYLTLLDFKESTFSIVPTDRGPDWRFNLNLVSIEY